MVLVVEEVRDGEAWTLFGEVVVVFRDLDGLIDYSLELKQREFRWCILIMMLVDRNWKR